MPKSSGICTGCIHFARCGSNNKLVCIGKKTPFTYPKNQYIEAFRWRYNYSEAIAKKSFKNLKKRGGLQEFNYVVALFLDSKWRE